MLSSLSVFFLQGFKYTSLILATIIITGLLAACGEEVTPRPLPTANSGAGKLIPLPTPTNIARPEFTPTPAATLIASTSVPLASTVTPLSSPSPLSGSVPAGTIIASEHDNGTLDIDQENPAISVAPGSGGAAVNGLKPDELSGQNGVSRLPFSNPSVTSKPVLKANYGSKGNPKVGIQAGHWMIEALPDDQASLRNQTGGAGGGVREVDYNLDIARRVTKLLQDRGIEVDLLPATVPVGYTADAFISIHADASTAGGPGGYKLARSRFSAIPLTDDSLMNWLYTTYGKATNLRRDSNITRNMTGYYAFNNRRRIHAISKNTPAAIIEMGYLTNSSDVAFLNTNRDTVARGIAEVVNGFLNSRPTLDRRERAAELVRGIEVVNDKAVIMTEPGGAMLALAAKGQQFEYSEVNGDYFSVFVPSLNLRGYLRRSDVTHINLPR